MNLQRPRNGEFHSAIYYKKLETPYEDEQGNKVIYEDGVHFEFKAPDDEQFRQVMQQYSQGQVTTNAKFHIYTSENLDIVTNSKVYIVNEDREFKVHGKRNMYNSPLSILNSLFPTVNSNKNQWMELGSLD
jgi:hypothetical protein